MTATASGRPSPARMLARGFAKRCPLCGGGGLFRRWLHMRERCPRCGYRFEREEGLFLGAYVINLALVQVVLLLGALVYVAVLASERSVGAGPVVASGVGVAVAGPVLFYPFSRTIWSAIELIMRPADAAEPGDRT